MKKALYLLTIPFIMGCNEEYKEKINNLETTIKKQDSIICELKEQRMKDSLLLSKSSVKTLIGQEYLEKILAEPGIDTLISECNALSKYKLSEIRVLDFAGSKANILPNTIFLDADLDEKEMKEVLKEQINIYSNKYPK